MFGLLQVVYQPVTPLGALAAAALVPVVGYVSKLGYDGLKTIFPWYDNLPSWVHQIVSPFWGLLFGFITAQTGAALLTDIHGVSPGFFGALLNAFVMAGIKRYEKSKEPTDATAVLQLTRMSREPIKTGRAPRRPRSALGSNPLTEERSADAPTTVRRDNPTA